MRTARPLVALLILAASSTAWGQTDSSTVALAPAVPPKLQRLVKAELPPGTVFESPEVQILLEIQLTATGSVSSVALLEGAGEPFDSAAVNAARQLEFEPARADDGTRAADDTEEI